MSSYLGKRLKYFLEVEGVAITAQEPLVWEERGKARAGAFNFEVWDPSSSVEAKLVSGKVIELWAGFVDKSVWDSTTKNDLPKLAGLIKTVRKRAVSGRRVLTVEGVDRSAIAHQYVVNKSYTGQRPDQIVIDAWTQFGPSGVTFNNVEVAGFTISDVQFPHDTLFELMEQMADLTGWIWRLDANGNLHFKASSNDFFGALKDSDSIVLGTAEFSTDASKLANRVWVFGAVDESDPFTEKWQGNGVQHTFPLAYRPEFTSVSVTVGGQAKSVGRDGVVDFSTADCLVNVEKQVLRFDPASPPASGAEVAITYTYGFPVIARREDYGSIQTYGLHEHVIVDAKITDIAQAAKTAEAYLREFGRPSTHGEMEVYHADIRAGQSVWITHSALGVDQQFTVDEVDREIHGPESAVITLKVRASPGPPKMEDKIRQLDQRVHALETKDIPQDAPVNTYQSIPDTLRLVATMVASFNAAESRIGYMKLGYSQIA